MASNQKQQKIDAGKLDRLILIQQATKTPDSSGQPIVTWTTYKSCYAKKEDVDLKEDEKFESGTQLIASDFTWWTMRFDENVNAEMRIVYGGLNYDLVGQPREIGRRQFMKVRTQLKDNV